MKKILTHLWKLLLLLIFLAAAFSYAMFQGGFVSWFLFYSFLPFALYALLLVCYPLQSFSAERSFSKTKVSAGEEVTVTLTLTRRIPVFPLYTLMIEDHFINRSASPKRRDSRKILVYPWFKRKIEVAYTINDLKRGEHLFHSLTLKTSDVFGLIEKETIIPLSDEILVYPRCEQIPSGAYFGYDDPSGVSSRDRIQRDTTMVSGVREYQPGDRFSWINWKATAKRNRMMTKEFEQHKAYDVLLVLDCTPSREFETLVSFTASMIRGMIRTGGGVGLLTTGSEQGRFAVQSSESHEHRLFQHLAKVTADGKHSLEVVLGEELAFLRQHAVLMLVTSADRLSEALIEKASYQALKNRGVYIFAVQNDRVPQVQTVFSEKGIQIISVKKGHFAEAFSEVNKR